MKKKLIALLLALSVLLTLMVGCQADKPADSQTPELPQVSEPGEDLPAEPIFERARSYSFVPEDFWDDPDELITMVDFCRLLSGVIALYDEGKLERWNELAALAMQLEETVHVDSALRIAAAGVGALLPAGRAAHRPVRLLLGLV